VPTKRISNVRSADMCMGANEDVMPSRTDRHRHLDHGLFHATQFPPHSDGAPWARQHCAMKDASSRGLGNVTLDTAVSAKRDEGQFVVRTAGSELMSAISARHKVA